MMTSSRIIEILEELELISEEEADPHEIEINLYVVNTGKEWSERKSK